MEHKDFLKYLDILKDKPFSLYPPPQGKDENQNGHLRAAKFSYVDDTPTHVIIADNATSKTYHIPLVLVDFASPGILRLTRQLEPWNGSFV
jgi:hypothetical protein